ncbi:alpha/beta hydrolase [Paraburkholderia unamae]|uniref:Acetyl esterase n=1 Tax=Paraburkholderia unamae TaxID=219649 RepID=A0ABX5KMZ8_9BURK|nr:alpha/beta hydrolase [Paraburkholderia unamae]PVX83657.1 acetyl esterase [Paraburkholderia unamae]RAR63804.1 acetyl esterase [Paraburkholderia unamae]
MNRIISALSFALALAGSISVTAAWADPALEQGTREFVDTLTAKGGPPIYTLSPSDARTVLLGAQSAPVSKLPAHIEDRIFPVGPTGDVKVRIIKPAKKSAGTLPVVMYFHGGGWVLGDAATHDRLVREIANGSDAAVVFVDYERSPEARYPTAIEQAYAATAYVAQHGKELDVDPQRMALAGDSVGGNMVAAVSILAKQRHGPKFRFQVLFYPVTDANFEDGSYQEFSHGPWLTKNAMKWFWDAYLPDASKRNEITASPLQATIADLQGLPPALVITDENDVLRDEGEAYAHKLMQAGVDVTAVRYLGSIHDFVMLNALSNTPAARAAIGQANAMLRRELHK